MSQSSSDFNVSNSQRYQRMMQSQGFGFWEWRPCDGSLLLNGGFWSTLGYDDAPVVKFAQFDELIPFVHPDDWEATFKKIPNAVADDINIDFRVRLFDSAGVIKWVNVVGHVSSDDDGEVSYVSGIVFDIDDHHKLEEQLRISEERHERILTAANDGIWEWSKDRGGFHFSSRCWQQLGYEAEDDFYLDGRNRLSVWRGLVHEEDRIKFDIALEKHLKGEGPFDIEYRIAAKDGSFRWIRARGQASVDEKGEAYCMSGTNMDITDIKAAEERVIQAKEVAEKANLAKSDFLSSMSHELRTPLNAILGYIQLLALDSNLTPPQHQSISEIKKAGHHLLSLINDVLDLSRVESGQLTLSLEPVNLGRIIVDCKAMIRPLAETRNVRLICNEQIQNDVYAMADGVRLKQALINLLNNAVKYNRDDGEVTISVEESVSGMIKIGITDTGVGIPAHMQAHVFEPFNRLGAERSAVEGTGVGLVITKRLVTMMGGDLSFVSREGVGTSFWLHLPKAEERTLSVPAVVESVEVKKASVLDRAGRYSVLYIEDNPSNIRLMEQVFNRFDNLALAVAKEAFYGLFRARTDQPDLIIMDVNLPGMDGFEALQVLRRDAATSEIPVVALSANALEQDVRKGLDSGFDRYLTKPLDVDELMQAMNALLPEKPTAEGV